MDERIIADLQGRIQMLEQRIQMLLLDVEAKEDQFLELMPHMAPHQKPEEPQKFKELFSLEVINSTQVKLTGNILKPGVSFSCFIAGVRFRYSGALDAVINIEEESYIYLKVSLNDYQGGLLPTVTREITNDVDDLDGDEKTECFPLWYIPFRDGEIDTENIWNLQRTIHITGFAT